MANPTDLEITTQFKDSSWTSGDSFVGGRDSKAIVGGHSEDHDRHRRRRRRRCRRRCRRHRPSPSSLSLSSSSLSHRGGRGFVCSSSIDNQNSFQCPLVPSPTTTSPTGNQSFCPSSESNNKSSNSNSNSNSPRSPKQNRQRQPLVCSMTALFTLLLTFLGTFQYWMATAASDRNAVATVGDSTLFHSVVTSGGGGHPTVSTNTSDDENNNNNNKENEVQSWIKPNHDNRTWIKEQKRRLRLYDASKNPIVLPSVFVPHSTIPLTVVYVDKSDGGDDVHRDEGLLQGLQASTYIQLVKLTDILMKEPTMKYPKSRPTVHLIDWASFRYSCSIVEAIYEAHRQSTSKQQQTTEILVYWDSSTMAAMHQDQVPSCPRLERHYAAIRRVARGIVTGRYWNPERQWVEPGQVVDPSTTTTTTHEKVLGSMLYASRTLSDAFVQEFRRLKKSPRDTNAAIKEATTTNAIRRFLQAERPVDVVILQDDSFPHFSRLRRTVTTIVQNDWAERANGGKVNITLVTDTSMIESFQILRQAQICIAAQHDDWESPPMSMLEAMASGCMVLLDDMLSPVHDIRNGTHLVTFHNKASLLRLLSFYHGHAKERQTVAKAGMNQVWAKHLPQHGVERILFGHAKSSMLH